MEIGYFEIPVTNMERAMAFYQNVFDAAFTLLDLGQTQMALLGDKGALVKHPSAYIPSNTEGPLLYFKTNTMDEQLTRVIVAGGKVLREKTKINDAFGCMALFEDSEGNRIALRGE